MNNERLEAIKLLYPRCAELSRVQEAAKAAVGAFYDACTELMGHVEAIMDEEQEYVENLPDNLKESEEAQAADASVEEALDEIMGMLDTSVLEEFDVDDVIGKLNEAVGG